MPAGSAPTASDYADGFASVNGVFKESYAYDVYGNMTRKGGKSLTWSRGSLLTEYGGDKYYYDYSGVRYKKVTGEGTVNYITDGAKILGETRGGSKEISYLYDAEELIGFEVWLDLSGMASYNGIYLFVKDALGNVVSLVKDYGGGAAVGVVADYEYDAFGNCTVTRFDDHHDIANLNPIRWKSQYYDTESGLYMINTPEGARYYDPALRIYISPLSPENILSLSGTVFGLNLYSLCVANPLSLCYNGFDLDTSLELVYEPPKLTKWQLFWRSLRAHYDSLHWGWKVGIGVALFAFAVGMSFATGGASAAAGTAISFAIGAGTSAFIGACSGTLGGFLDGVVEGVFWGGIISFICAGVGSIRALANRAKIGQAVKAKDYNALAKLFTHNDHASEVMIGKWDGGGATSYVAKAGKTHTYFAMPSKTFTKLSVKLGNKNMWEINQAFLTQQIGKTFYASHAVTSAIIDSYFWKEIQFLVKSGISIF
jgi:RHS repeat-associated protein